MLGAVLRPKVPLLPNPTLFPNFLPPSSFPVSSLFLNSFFLSTFSFASLNEKIKSFYILYLLCDGRFVLHICVLCLKEMGLLVALLSFFIQRALFFMLFCKLG